MAVADRRLELTDKVQMPEGDRRLRELIIYISDKCEADPTYGATKLNKILFYSDFQSFLERRKPVTGEEYQRLEHGPAPRRLVPIRREMESAGDIVVRDGKYHDKDQHRVIALRPADLGIFDGEDIAIVDRVIDELWGKTAKEVSHISHGPWWKVCRDGQTIPYEFGFLTNEPLTPADIDRTKEMARDLGWQA